MIAPPERSENVLYALFLAGQSARRLLAAAFDGGPVLQEEWGVLSTIGAFGPLTPTELGARLGMPPTTLSAQIRRLLERDLVEQTPNPADGRSYLVGVSERGREAVVATVPRFRAALEAVTKELRVPAAEVRDLLDELRRACAVAVDRETTKS